MARSYPTISDSEVAARVPEAERSLLIDQAMSNIYRQLGSVAHEPGVGPGLVAYIRNMGGGERDASSDARKMHEVIQKAIITPMNRRARRVRDKWYETRDFEDEAADVKLLQSAYGMEPGALMKAQLDVNDLTDFSAVTGGQALGYFSLDTRMARSTVRPNSFTLYQALEKSLAWQIVDFWATATDTGAPPPGAAFAGFSSVSSGALATTAGLYSTQDVILKLALNGRAITTALAAQNNYVNVSEQENTNAALAVLESINYALYWGNSTLYANQYNGLSNLIPSANVFDYQAFSNAYASSNSWSPVQTLFNQIYEVAAQVTSYGTYGHLTHAFMPPTAMGGLQGLSTTLLNNIITTLTDEQRIHPEITANGNLVGMNTRVGNISFPQDMFIDARKMPASAFPGKTSAMGWGTTTSPTTPTSVTCAVLTGAAATGSEFTSAYAGSYVYAVAATDANGIESTLAYSSSVSGGVNNAIQLTVTRGATDNVNFRVYRSGLGYSKGSPAPSDFRWIGDVAVSGATTTYTDYNTTIPGSSEIFLLDMDPLDFALDFRMLLPLVRVELFASSLFMPWAIAMIGALRLRIPKFNAMIKNYVPPNPAWNPLSANNPSL